MPFEPTTPTLAQLQQAAQLIDMKVSEMPAWSDQAYEVQHPTPNGTGFSWHDTRAEVAAILQQAAKARAESAMSRLAAAVSSTNQLNGQR